jgi:hypothetical protein
MKSLRLRLFLAHLAISASVIGACVAFIVFVWYPPPLAQLEGIFSILLIMAGVDICAGPLCTLIAASPKKPRSELARDLAIIGGVQLLALAYALYTTYLARPAFMVYNLGEFEVEHANELKPEELAKARYPEFSRPPLFGPVYVDAPSPSDPAEAARIAGTAIMTGFDIKDMPRYFEHWPREGTDVRAKAKLVSKLPPKGALKKAVSALLEKKGIAEEDVGLLPVFGRLGAGTVIVRRSDLAIVGIIPFLSP